MQIIFIISSLKLNFLAILLLFLIESNLEYFQQQCQMDEQKFESRLCNFENLQSVMQMQMIAFQSFQHTFHN